MKFTEYVWDLYKSSEKGKREILMFQKENIDNLCLKFDFELKIDFLDENNEPTCIYPYKGLFEALENDKVNNATVKAHVQGLNGRALSALEFAELLILLESKGQSTKNLPKLPIYDRKLDSIEIERVYSKVRKEMNQKHYLFSYGTLQLTKVQLENYGRILSGEKDSLKNYKLEKVQITDDEVLKKSGIQYHPIAVKTNSPNDCLEGTIFEVSDEELLQTDKYEVSEYKRVLEIFDSGREAWVYVAKAEKPTSTIQQNIDQIRQRIQKACEQSHRNSNEVKLLLATKTVDAERIKTALQYGETLVAENKVQEIKQKYEALKEMPHQQHFIGHLQTNKIKEILKYDVTCIQSLDRWGLAEKLHQQLTVQKKTIEAFIQVNTSAEESKFGIGPKEALAFTKRVATLGTIKIKGLMTIGLFSSDEIKVRACFKRLRAVQQEIIEAKIPNVQMHELSMGMSGDLEIAIEEGATIVRVGTAIFGQRQYPDSYYWNEKSKD